MSKTARIPVEPQAIPPSTPADIAAARAAAASVGCMLECDFLALTGITPKTAAVWRKGRRGPQPVRTGVHWLYNRMEIDGWLRQLFAERDARHAD